MNYLGFNLAFLSAAFFLFLTLGSIARKYKSSSEATIWGIAYFISFGLEHFVYFIL